MAQRLFVMGDTTITHAQQLRAMTAPLGFRCCRTPDCKHVVAAWALYADVDSRYPYEKGWTIPDTPHPPPYEIKPIESKGRGMITSRAILKGEVILNERPAILTPRLSFSNDPKNISRGMDETMLQLLYWLEQEDRQKVVQLHNCKPLDECGPLAGILRTNAIGVFFPESQICPEYSAICLNISLVNHSCIPNSAYTLDKGTMVFTLRATRDIALGEEITITYLDDGKTSTVRKTELQKKYGFTCTCALCSAPAAATAASDERREFIKATAVSVKKMWKDWVKIAPGARKAQTKRNVETVEKLLQAMNKENIHEGRVDAMQKCVFMYAVLCDMKNFKKWAGRCLEVAKEDDRADVKDWESWVKDPTSFPLWDLWRVQIANLMQQSAMRS